MLQWAASPHGVLTHCLLNLHKLKLSCQRKQVMGSQTLNYHHCNLTMRFLISRSNYELSHHINLAYTNQFDIQKYLHLPPFIPNHSNLPKTLLTLVHVQCKMIKAHTDKNILGLETTFHLSCYLLHSCYIKIS